MARKTPNQTPAQDQANFERLTASYKRSLRATNLSERTVETYSDSVKDLARYLTGKGLELAPTAIHREHIEDFLANILNSISPKTKRPYKPATANNRYRGLQAYFKWLLEMGEITVSPLQFMKPPMIPESPPPVLSEDQIRRLLRSCEGTSFEKRRDMAILRLFIDTGMRCSELTHLRVDQIDWDMQVVPVLGKGRKRRLCPVGKKTLKALDLYINWGRNKHRYSARAELWLGHEGPMTVSGIYQVVRDRAAAVGIKGYPHLLRHLAAHRYLAAGGQESNLMRLMGWSSRSMVTRYAASAADERARDEHQRLALGDQF